MNQSEQAPVSAEQASLKFGAKHPEAVLLAYSPDSAAFYRWAAPANAWVGPENHTPKWAVVFEVRAFDSSAEMRWVHEAKGLGSAFELPCQAAVEGAQYQRRLWGEADRDAADAAWVKLKDSRIGSLTVPLPAGERGPRGEIALVAVEQLSQDAHGNWSVVDERLCGLEWVE